MLLPADVAVVYYKTRCFMRFDNLQDLLADIEKFLASRDLARSSLSRLDMPKRYYAGAGRPMSPNHGNGWTHWSRPRSGTTSNSGGAISDPILTSWHCAAPNRPRS